MIGATKLSPLCLGVLLLAGLVRPVGSQQARSADTAISVIDGMPSDVFVQIVQAEDTRQWDADRFGKLFGDPNRRIGLRAVQAAGRIGDEGAVLELGQLLASGADDELAATAAFALGEIESAAATDELLDAIQRPRSNRVRASAMEALGKIAAPLTERQAGARRRIGEAILGVLSEQHREPRSDRQLTLMALTAVLRARPEGGPAVVALFLNSPEPRVREDALNTLARLRANEALDRIKVMLVSDADPRVRANAARVLGAAADLSAVDALSTRMTSDTDSRVRVGAIRALALPDSEGAATALLKHGEVLQRARPPQTNELLELVTALGRALQNTNHDGAAAFLAGLRTSGVAGFEVEMAFARIAPGRYLADPAIKSANADWQQVSAVAQALGEIAVLKDGASVSAAAMKASALDVVQSLMQSPSTPTQALPDVLRALQRFEPANMNDVIRARLKASDVMVRMTAADILAELPPSPETSRALSDALPQALQDSLNDAALSIVGALASARDPVATAALVRAAQGTDYLVRRRAVEGLRNRPGVTPPAVGPVNTRNTRADYLRAGVRIGTLPRAVLTTDRGVITIEMHPGDAPLTVDNFITLARSQYFNGLTFHRVVPTFVIQGGDPRGDGSGGPGYLIRCEINPAPYDTGAVGMALSGKDTGGSQFFITHSPQPHLDGGYTVFGRVVEGMSAVDAITRGDRIRTVAIVE